MRRRKYLALTGLSVGLAGCSGSDKSNQAGGAATTATASPTATTSPTESSTPTESPTESPTDSPTPEPPSFELVSFKSPSKAEIGKQVTLTFTVKNTGERAGTFETTMSYTDSSSSGWTELDGTWSREIPGGESYTFESTKFTSQYMLTQKFRLDAFNKAVSINWVSKTLSFGQTYTNPDKVKLTVLKEETTEKFTYTYSGYTYEETASEGKTWLFVTVRAKNTSGSPAYLPLYSDWVVVAGDSQYDAVYTSKEDGKYKGGEVQPSIVREGWVLYEVPDKFKQASFDVVWSEQYYDGDVAAYWNSG